MQRFLVATLTGAGILVGFFMGGCGLVMLGLAVYETQKNGVAAGKEVLFHAWPFFIGLLVFLAATWQGFRSGKQPALATEK